MIKIHFVGRECNGCTKCCEGWLYGSAYGYEFSPYKKCVFLNKGCTIYPVRPDNPCKQFQCHWKSNKSLPEWLKPDISNVIILKKTFNNFEYLRIVPAGVLVNKQVHEWSDSYSKENIRNNVIISDNTGYYVYSSDKKFKEIANEFIK